MSRPQDFFRYKQGELYAENIPVSKLAKKFGTPLYIYSKKAFLTPLKELQKNLSSLDYQICFAVKSNSNLSILSLLAKNGAGMDLVSGGELFRAKKIKIPGNKLVFSGVGKTKKEMREALQYPGDGIYSFHVESLEELEQLNSVAKKLKKIAPIAFRYNPDVNPKTHPYISTGLKKNKFGLSLNEIQHGIKLLKKLPWINLKGLSIHIGSQLTDLAPLEESFIKLRELAQNLPLEYIDVGGGLGITYQNEHPPSIESYCKLICRVFKNTKFRILLEPGRSISGNSGVLVTEILYRKKRTSQDFLIVDTAMNDLIRPALYEGWHDIVPVQKKQSTHSSRALIVGPVCESADILGSNRLLSKNLASGDLLAILSAGAYGFSMSSQYNSRPRIAEVLVDGAKAFLIGKRESYTDLIQREEHLYKKTRLL